MSKLLYIVAVDGSEWAKRAVQRAVNLAEQTHAQVKLITVMNWSYMQPMAMEGIAPPLLDKDTEQANTEKSILTPLVEQYKNSAVKVSSEILWGDAVTEILKQVKDRHANMLFVGRQGRSRIIDLMLGSVANKLAHRVGVPIVLVP